MSLGFFLWLVVALGIGGFTWWSMRVQMLQKKSWKAFADRYNLSFEGGKLFDRPSLEGEFEGKYIRIYEGDELDRGGRIKRAILAEAEMGHVLPFNVIMAKRSESAVVTQVSRQLNLKQRPKLKSKVWDPKNIVATDDEQTMSLWLNTDRLAAIQKVLSIPKTKGVFVSNDGLGYFAVQVDDPMLNPKMLVKLFKRLTESVSILEIPELLDDEASIADEDDAINFDEPEEAAADTQEAETTETDQSEDKPESNEPEKLAAPAPEEEKQDKASTDPKQS